MAKSARVAARTSGLPEPERTGLVPLALIMRDERVNTREVDEVWVERRIPRFSEAGMGTLAVSLRADGTYIVLDGQNRAELKRRAAGAGTQVKCDIFVGLAIAEEAELFGILNDSRALTPLHKFLARLTEGEPDAVEISATAARCSWKIADSTAPGVLKCVSTLERVHRNDKARKKGAEARDLERTLRCIAEAWGHSSGTSDSGIIGGIGAVFNFFEEAIDPRDLNIRLGMYAGGAIKLLTDARGLKAFRGGTIVNSVAELVVDCYNDKRKSRRLPKWRR